jgi:hypothetical protein
MAQIVFADEYSAMRASPHRGIGQLTSLQTTRIFNAFTDNLMESSVLTLSYARVVEF